MKRLEAGTVSLVGTDCSAIAKAVIKLLDDDDYYFEMSRSINPYGDGRSSEMITSLIRN